VTDVLKEVLKIFSMEGKDDERVEFCSKVRVGDFECEVKVSGKLSVVVNFVNFVRELIDAGTKEIDRRRAEEFMKMVERVRKSERGQERGIQ